MPLGLFLLLRLWLRLVRQRSARRGPLRQVGARTRSSLPLATWRRRWGRIFLDAVVPPHAGRPRRPRELPLLRLPSPTIGALWAPAPLRAPRRAPLALAEATHLAEGPARRRALVAAPAGPWRALVGAPGQARPLGRTPILPRSPFLRAGACTGSLVGLHHLCGPNLRACTWSRLIVKLAPLSMLAQLRVRPGQSILFPRCLADAALQPIGGAAVDERAEEMSSGTQGAHTCR
mmetsp:Transcript_173202/g.555479  ORF Transcript_173202/g.555479 Transcript_173202/m.555479 type:complete len:233 (+) Transcript_173202:1737-2435(+)